MNTTYQNFYPTLTSPQEPNPILFNPDMIDDWLADELCQSGMLMNLMPFEQPSVFPGLETDYPNSPPISPSTTTTSQSSTPLTSNDDLKSKITIPLFPEIQPKKKLLLPKSTAAPNSLFPRIAPRPVVVQQPIIRKSSPPPPPPPVLCPITPVQNNKRPLSEKEQDEIALKRQKNTDAARRSRMKKLMKMEVLEQKVNDLESDNNKLTTRIAVLESEKYGLESKSSSYEDRIKVLEAQLAEAHRALTKA